MATRQLGWLNHDLHAHTALLLDFLDLLSLIGYLLGTRVDHLYVFFAFLDVLRLDGQDGVL